MTTNDTCPYCGAEKEFGAGWYACGNHVGSEFRYADCYKRQIDQLKHGHERQIEQFKQALIYSRPVHLVAAQAAEIERLRGALDKINALLPQHDSDGNLFKVHHDSDGHAQFEPVNAGVLVTEIAALITEEKEK